MRHKFVILLLLTQFLALWHHFAWSDLAKAQVVSSPQHNITDNQLVDFPEVGLAIPKPDGFEKATAFHGFQQAFSSSSVLLAKVPAPFSEIRKVINKQSFAKAQLSLISQQPIKISNQNGLLLNLEQSVFSQKVQKWIVVFGDDTNTYWITAAFFQADALNIGEPLKKIVLAATISSSQPSISSWPFSIKAVDGLMIAHSLSGLGKAVGFTKNGQIPQLSPQDPIFMVAPSLGDVWVPDHEKFADQRLRQYRGTKINSIKSSNKILIDNLSGWEIEATGQDEKNKTPLKLYQVMLFPPQGGYVLMTGIVGTQQANVYLPKFKAIAQTYKKK